MQLKCTAELKKVLARAGEAREPAPSMSAVISRLAQEPKAVWQSGR